MSKRLGLLGVVVLVSIGLLVACGSNYNSSSDGLFLVGSQGSGVIETFSFNLNSGHVSPIANSPNDTAAKTCILNGLPSSLVMDPKGAYAYTIINATSACDTSTNKSATGIQAFKVTSGGSMTAVGSLRYFEGRPRYGPCSPLYVNHGLGGKVSVRSQPADDHFRFDLRVDHWQRRQFNRDRELALHSSFDQQHASRHHQCGGDSDRAAGERHQRNTERRVLVSRQHCPDLGIFVCRGHGRGSALRIPGRHFLGGSNRDDGAEPAAAVCYRRGAGWGSGGSLRLLRIRAATANRTV